jgi:hypothetical protein
MRKTPTKRRTSEMRAKYDFSAGVRGKHTRDSAFGGGWRP